jgi:hypothetical protein
MFSQFFANPAMLLGAFAITAPIALFLLNRFRFRTVEWAALIFLERAFRRQKRRLQLENLILLLIRCLILILLALAMARPTIRGDVPVDEEEASRNVVLLLDTSFSTGYQVGSTEDDTVRRRSLRAAKDLVAALKNGDRVNVVAYDETVRVLYASPVLISDGTRKSVLTDLEEAHELEASQRGTDLGEALHVLPRVLRPFDFDPSGMPPPEGAPPLKKTVFLLGDAQRLGFLDGKGQLIDKSLANTAAEIKQLGGALLLVNCGAVDPVNVTVSRLETREPVVGRGLPCHIQVSLTNASALPLKDLTVEYYVDAPPGPRRAPQKMVSVGLGPESEVTPDPLRYVFRKAGLHRVEVRVKSDALQIDNSRHLVIDVREEVRVLLVDGENRDEDSWESETDFLKAALEITDQAEGKRGLIRTTPATEADLASRRLEDEDLIVIANVVSLSEDVVHKLEEYTRQGGSLIFTVGGQVKAESYNELLWRGGKGLLPCKLLEKRGNTKAKASVDETAPEWVVTLGQHEGHAVSMFAEKELGDWMHGASVFGFYTVELEPKEKPEGWTPPWVPLTLVPRTSGGDDVPNPGAASQPLLVEHTYGRGRVSVYLTTADDDWNNAVVYDVFYVLFWRELVLDLTRRARPLVNLSIGDRYERIFSAEEYAARIEIEAPSERREGVPLEKLEGLEQFRLVYPVAEESGGLQEGGLYTLERKGLAQGIDPDPDYFAVRIDPREGDLAAFAADELAEALNLSVRQIKPAAAREALVADTGSAGNREYWREVIAAVLALLVLESILAALFGRRRK